MKRLMICMTIIAAMATLTGCEKASGVQVQSGEFNVERLFIIAAVWPLVVAYGVVRKVYRALKEQ